MAPGKQYFVNGIKFERKETPKKSKSPKKPACLKFEKKETPKKSQPPKKLACLKFEKKEPPKKSACLKRAGVPAKRPRQLKAIPTCFPRTYKRSHFRGYMDLDLCECREIPKEELPCQDCRELKKLEERRKHESAALLEAQEKWKQAEIMAGTWRV
jgi:hypothetical protein